MKPQLLERNR